MPDASKPRGFRRPSSPPAPDRLRPEADPDAAFKLRAAGRTRGAGSLRLSHRASAASPPLLLSLSALSRRLGAAGRPRRLPS